MRRTVSHLQAAGLALLGYSLWVLCDVSLKFAGASTLPRLEIIALVGLAAALIVMLAAAVRGQIRSLLPRQPVRQVLRSLLDMGNNIGVLIALQHASLTMFYILVFLSPLVAAVLAHLWLRERLGWQRILALALGFCGIVIAVNPLSAVHHADAIGYAACAVCVACFSANMVWSRRLTQTESANSLAFVSGITIALVAGACTAGHLQSVSLRMSGVIVAISVFGVVGNLCFFFALRHAATAYVSQFHYSQLPVGAVIGYVLWGERLTLAMLLGAILIVAAGMYTAATEKPSVASEIAVTG
ncbi:DMT family transporter [Terriglobus aquaticus]|uniref:DMT family transporter n=1 Tax=Terriglobus aquaticus TaxID=940139 RepID=A0ABW9KPC9_9BACT|nr:DMT family transporter [Terriglobus aquaticus]